MPPKETDRKRAVSASLQINRMVQINLDNLKIHTAPGSRGVDEGRLRQVPLKKHGTQAQLYVYDIGGFFFFIPQSLLYHLE